MTYSFKQFAQEALAVHFAAGAKVNLARRTGQDLRTRAIRAMRLHDYAPRPAAHSNGSSILNAASLAGHEATSTT